MLPTIIGCYYIILADGAMHSCKAHLKTDAVHCCSRDMSLHRLYWHAHMQLYAGDCACQVQQANGTYQRCARVLQ